MAAQRQMLSVYVVRLAAGAEPEFLQLKRAADDYLGGTWQTVSGGLEATEPAWRGALRELREETGLTPAEFFRLPATRSFYTGHDDTIWSVIAFCAIVDPAAAVTLNGEHTAFRWVRQSSVDSHFMWPTDRDSIGELCCSILSPASPTRELLRIRFDPR